MPLSPILKPGEIGSRAIRLAKYFRVWYRWNRQTLKGFEFDPYGENLFLDLRLGEIFILFLVEGIGRTVSSDGTYTFITEWEEQEDGKMVEKAILYMIDSSISPIRFAWDTVKSVNFDIPELFKLRRSIIPPAIQTFCRLIGV